MARRRPVPSRRHSRLTGAAGKEFRSIRQPASEKTSLLASDFPLRGIIMPYAVLDKNEAILSQTPDFDPQAPSARVALSAGMTLLTQPGADDELASLRRRLDDALNENAAKESFLSSMSHDLRTPMNAIVGLTALAKKHLDEKARLRDTLDKIDTASGHLLNLINDVLDISRINSGRLQLNEERFSLSDVMHEVMTIIRPQMEKRGHSWRFEADHIESEMLSGDTLRLRQIYVNIISNAVKYTPAGGDITIGVDEKMIDGEKCELTFTCRDNGVGMTAEFLKRIFDPFERDQNRTTAQIEGTGLGMSIVKKLVEAMSGSIEIESEPGRGTFVTIAIPLKRENMPFDFSPLQDRRVLVIEADERYSGQFRQYLSEASVASIIAPSMAAALDALTQADVENTPFDCVIIGQRQENATAFDAAQYLHKSRPELPLIWVSDADWGKLEYQAQRSGIAAFIPQPVFRKTLLNGLIDVLRREGGPAQSAQAYPDLTGKRLLLVDDNMINREIAKEILSVTHVQVDTAENGQEAVDKYLAGGEGYALILMDIQMPVMDGYEAARAIRASSRPDAKSIPIIAMTANTFAEDIRRARDAGMNGHLAKPVSVDTLMNRLREAVR